MARRYTDSEKWKDEWWSTLSNDNKIVWQYLIDTCTIAGRWKKDFRSLNFYCAVDYDEAKLVSIFGDRLVDYGKFFFIPSFIKYQYPHGITSNKPAVISIRRELQEYGLFDDCLKMYQSLGNDNAIIKDKDIDKDIDKDKDIVKRVLKICNDKQKITDWTKQTQCAKTFVKKCRKADIDPHNFITVFEKLQKCGKPYGELAFMPSIFSSWFDGVQAIIDKDKKHVCCDVPMLKEFNHFVCTKCGKKVGE